MQTVARGPVAALEFIKKPGTNGGGFFNANGAHPFENPTPLAILIELLAIVVLPAALLVGASNFLPALALGPLLEHFMTWR